jgi:hypothetical protein
LLAWLLKAIPFSILSASGSYGRPQSILSPRFITSANFPLPEGVLEKKNIRVKQTTGRRKEVHLILLGDDDVSQFKDKIQGITQLANQKGFNIKIIQYMKATGTFTSLR